MDLKASEAAKYIAIWGERNYRVTCHGLDLYRERRDLFPPRFGTAIDIGCGLGLLVGAWLEEGIAAMGVDLVPEACLDDAMYRRYRNRFVGACLWEYDPGQVFDVGVCADVMEHIPGARVSATLQRISGYCRRVVFKINAAESTRLGFDLHLSRHPAPWWLDTIEGAMGGSAHTVPYDSPREDFVILWEPGA